jgi:hypothetical protein
MPNRGIELITGPGSRHRRRVSSEGGFSFVNAPITPQWGLI